jgi:hypothetical protein
MVRGVFGVDRELSGGAYKVPISFLYPLYMLVFLFSKSGFLSIVVFPWQDVFC